MQETTADRAKRKERAAYTTAACAVVRIMEQDGRMDPLDAILLAVRYGSVLAVHQARYFDARQRNGGLCHESS
jgi:hypothetical protein